MYAPTALSKQGKTRSHDLAPSRFAPRSVQAGEGATFNDCRAVPFYPACPVRAGKGSVQRLSSRQALPRLRYPCRKGRVHMALRRLTSSRPLRPGEEGLETMLADSRMLPRALSKQERTRSHDPVPSRFTPSVPSKLGGGSVHRLSSLHALTLPALSEQERARSHDVVPHASTHRTVCAGRAMFTGCCTVIRHLIRFVRTGKSMARPAAWHIQSPRLLRGLCENSIQLFSRGSLASSGKDHFHNWKEQSCLSVRMDTSPSENLNFSAQLSIQERTRQAMCSVPASKWYNGIAS